MADPVESTVWWLMAESGLKTDLILQGRIARRPVIFVGTLDDGKLSQISGSVALDVSLSSILKDLSEEYPDAPGILTQFVGNGDIVLEKMGAAYRSSGSKSIQVGLIIKFAGSSIQFALLKGLGEQKGFIAGVDMRSDKLAVPGNILSGLIGDISIGNLGVSYASEAFDDVSFFGADEFQEAGRFNIMTPELTSRKFPKGVNFSAEILVGGVNLLDQLVKLQGTETPSSKNQETLTGQNETDKAKAVLNKGPTRWFEVNKTIGPLSVRRMGLMYADQKIGIKLDAGLQLACLTFKFEGLGLSYPLDQFTTKPKKIWKHLQFLLDGAAVIFEQGPLTIAGGLLKVNDSPLQLDGTLLVKTQLFTISAIGSYADLNGTPSFFVFAALQKELGGPAFFFVLGLSFGFGLNRRLKLPAINEVHNFPLVRAATDPNYLGKDLDLRLISDRLSMYIPPSPGNFWVAAGVKFTSFGLVDSIALLSASFGTRFEIAMLGLAKLRIPRELPGGDSLPVIVYVEMAFKVAFSTESGLLSFEARLTENSYVLRKDFKLRGGFAFYTWFAGRHAGDFVISLGGYHPRFQPPVHYPKPDLVQFICKIGAVTIKGYCYFALCPAAIMAGGGLSIIYQSGGIKAWFIAYADFLIQWKPLYYDIAIGISIGVALNLKIGIIRINLSLELSASVSLHGPPLGGKARISLWIISFTVKFGAGKHLPPPMSWESKDSEKSFAKSFLPNPDVTRITVADGLRKEIKLGDQTHRFVNPQKLNLTFITLVPATEVRFNEKPPLGNDCKPLKIPRPSINNMPTDLGVRPMDKSSLYSRIDILFEPEGDHSEAARQYLEQYLDISLTTRSVPLALWGKDKMSTKSPPKADEQMIDNALVGLEIRTKAGPRPWETPVLELKVLAYDRLTKQIDWSGVIPSDALPGYGKKTISNTINDSEVVAIRNGILDRLIATGRKTRSGKDIQLNHLAANAEYIFQALPEMARVGQYPPRRFPEV